MHFAVLRGRDIQVMHGYCLPGIPNKGAKHQAVHLISWMLMCAGRGRNGVATGDVQTGTEAIPTCWEKEEPGPGEY